MVEKISADVVAKRVIAICEITIEGERSHQQCKDIVPGFPDENLFNALNELQEIGDETSIKEVIKKMKKYYEAVTDSEFLENLYTKEKVENSAVKLMLGLPKQNSQAEIFYKVYKNSEIEENNKAEEYEKEINKANDERKNDITYDEGDYSDLKDSFEDAYKSVYKSLEGNNYPNCKVLLENSKGNDEHVDVDFINNIKNRLKEFYDFWSDSVEKATNRMEEYEEKFDNKVKHFFDREPCIKNRCFSK